LDSLVVNSRRELFDNTSNFSVTGAAVRSVQPKCIAGLHEHPLCDDRHRYAIHQRRADEFYILFEVQPVLASEAVSNPEPVGFALMARGILWLLTYRKRGAKRAV
jgi:hypothetical protein